ncbi:MAG: hypothetical protein K2W95_17660 [Candidatus Obscuribacterales bacterium]|nr:hypothetical protein [Candidatus Obscuribacterales bacterium]
MMNVCVTANRPAIVQGFPMTVSKRVATLLLACSLVALSGYVFFRHSIQVSVVHAFFPTMELGETVR